MDNHGNPQNQDGSQKDEKKLNGTDTKKNNLENGSDQAGKQDGDNQNNSNKQDVSINTIDISPKTFLELLPSKQGSLLAAMIADIMTEGLTPVQENILGNFISAVGTLISYKASRDELDERK